MNRLFPIVLLTFSQSASAQETSLPDLTGRWAQVVVHRSLSAIPVVGEVASVTTTRLLVTMQQDGSSVRATAKVCDMRIIGSKMVRTSIPAAMIRSMPERSWETTLSRSVAGTKLAPWSRWDVLGATLQRPAEEPLPTRTDDPHVHDQDGDGHPGVTIAVRGLIDGEVYVTQKGWSELRPESVTQDRIAGGVVWRQMQTVLGASSRFLSAGPVTRPDPAPDANWFVAVRLDASADCATVNALPAVRLRR